MSYERSRRPLPAQPRRGGSSVAVRASAGDVARTSRGRDAAAALHRHLSPTRHRSRALHPARRRDRDELRPRLRGQSAANRSTTPRPTARASNSRSSRSRASICSPTRTGTTPRARSSPAVASWAAWAECRRTARSINSSRSRTISEIPRSSPVWRSASATSLPRAPRRCRSARAACRGLGLRFLVQARRSSARTPRRRRPPIASASSGSA